MKQWERRIAKAKWRSENKDKADRATKLWRQLHKARYNQGARARMERYRQRLRVTFQSSSGYAKSEGVPITTPPTAAAQS
jgi:hypothetical protein